MSDRSPVRTGGAKHNGAHWVQHWSLGPTHLPRGGMRGPARKVSAHTEYVITVQELLLIL